MAGLPGNAEADIHLKSSLARRDLHLSSHQYRPEFHLVRVGLQLEGGRQQLCDHQAGYGGPLLPALSTPTISLSMASPDQPPSTRKLAAILSADIAGYSALMSSDEEGTVRKLREVQEAV